MALEPLTHGGTGPVSQPVLAYLESCRNGLPDLDDEAWQDVRRTVADTVATRIARHGVLRRTGEPPHRCTLIAAESCVRVVLFKGSGGSGGGRRKVASPVPGHDRG